MHLLTRPVRRFWACLRGAGARSAVAAPHAAASLICTYDRDADLLFARFGSPDDADTVMVEPDVAVRISRATHQPIGIEVIDCAAKFHKQPSAITPAFARELLARYARQAQERLAGHGVSLA